MPIAFDSPASAPHGTLPTRAARLGDDDAVSADIFTQLLLAAAGVQEATAPPEAAPPAKETRTAKDEARAAVVDAALMLPLPPAVQPPANPTVTIVATEKRSADAHETVPVASISSRGTAAAAAAMPATMSLPAHLMDATSALPLHALSSKTPGDAAPDPHADPRVAPDVPVHAAVAQAAQPDAAPSRPAAAPTWLSLAAVADKPSAPKGAQDTALPAPGAVTPHAAALAPAHAPIVLETVSAPAFTPGWQDETVSKLAHIVLTRNERAELKLNPAELGPVNIRVEMHAPDQASIMIVAASPETRSALEQSLPQLRDLLSSQGITLGQASVQDGAAQRDPAASQWQGDRRASEPAAPATRDNVVQLAAWRANRLVDIFA